MLSQVLSNDGITMLLCKTRNKLAYVLLPVATTRPAIHKTTRNLATTPGLRVLMPFQRSSIGRSLRHLPQVVTLRTSALPPAPVCTGPCLDDTLQPDHLLISHLKCLPTLPLKDSEARVRVLLPSARSALGGTLRPDKPVSVARRHRARLG